MIWHVFIALLVLFLTWVVHNYFQALRYKSNIPGPTIYPLILNDYVLWYYKVDRKRMLTDYFKKYGDTFALISHGSKQIMTKNLSNVQYSTSKQLNFSNYKRQVGALPFIRQIIGNGIFGTDDEIWEIQRLHAKPLFKRDKIQEMVPVFLKKAESLMSIFENSTKSKEPLNIQKLFFEFTFDVFGEIGFGVNFKAMGNNSTFLRDFDRTMYFLVAFQSITTRIFYNHEFYSIKNRIDKFIYDIIQERKNVKNVSELPDLLSQFMSLRDPADKPYPDKWLRDIVFNFIIAGRDTTAALLTWLCYLLTTHPAVLDKLMEEVDTLKDMTLTEPIISKLKYLDYVVKETLRLKSPVPSVNRGVFADDILPDGSKLKAGIRLRYWSYFFQRDPKYWDDPESFIPERWAKKDVIQNSYQYAPFHMGPMTCLGRKMAEIEAKTIIILILQRFRLSIIPGHSYEPFLGVTTYIPGGCPVFVTKYEKKG